MSKLVEAAAEFLSRDTSTKQIKKEEDLVEGLMSALAGKIIKGAANRQTPQQIANTTVATINKKAPGTKMHNHPNFSKFKQAVHSYVSAAKTGEEAFKRSSDDHVKGLAKKHFNEEVELEEAHKVSVTVSDPNHTMVTKRNERMEKRVIVKADNKDHAIVKAKEFYKKKGLKVHSAEYHSAQPASSLK